MRELRKNFIYKITWKYEQEINKNKTIGKYSVKKYKRIGA